MLSDLSPLYMVSLRVDLPALFTIGRRHRLPPRQADHGYLAHCLLTQLFGDHAPTPFALRCPRGRHVELLGYSAIGGETLHDHARTYAEPATYRACDWDQLCDKQMPTEWPVGHRLGFEVRVCPVVRMGSAGPTHRKGAEVDAFLAHAWKAGPDQPVDREGVYRQWLIDHVDRHGGARLCEAKLKHFRLARLVRRTHTQSDRRSALCARPEATVAGTLVVADSAAFHSLLLRGIGRHRAFGFGMLLLRPASTSC